MQFQDETGFHPGIFERRKNRMKRYNSWLGIILAVCLLFNMLSSVMPAIYSYAAEDTDEAIMGDVLSENFNGYATGNKPDADGWSYSENQGTISIVEIPDDADKSMQIQRTEKSAKGELWARYTLAAPVTGTYVVRVKAMAMQTDATAYIMNIRESSKVELANILFYKGNICHQLSTGQSITLQAYEKDRWYDIVTVIDTEARQYSVYIDGLKRIGPVDFKNTADKFSYVEFQVYRESIGIVCYDDLNIYAYNLGLDKNEITLEQGESETLIATVYPGLAGLNEVMWTSENTSVAVVDPNGKVSAVSPGTSVIKAETEAGAIAQCTVTVTEGTYVPVEGISVWPNTLSMYTGESKDVFSLVEPENASNRKVAWISGSPSVVSVVYDAYTGIATMTGISPGSAEVMAVSEDGGHEDICLVTVKESGDLFRESFDLIPTGSYPASLNPDSPVSSYSAYVSEIPGMEDKSLRIERTGSNESSSYYVRKTLSEEPSRAIISFRAMASQTNIICFIPVIRGPGQVIAQIAFYNDGKIKVYNEGSWNSAGSELQSYEAGRWYDFKIVLDANSKKYDIYIDDILKAQQLSFVNDQAALSRIEFGIYRGSDNAGFYINDLNIYSYRSVNNVSLMQNTTDLAVGSSMELFLNIEPEMSLFRSIRWTSTGEDIVHVDGNGKITALAEGSATITAIVEDTVTKDKYTASCTVNAFIQPVERIYLDIDQLQIPVGSSGKLKAFILPENASYKEITWSSDDQSTARVDENGEIFAVSPGTTVIRAAAHGNIEAQCVVEVVERTVQASFYVAPYGDDHNPGTEEQPFKTPERAMDAVRSINTGMSGDIIVYFREGTYTLEQTLTFDERDSGSNGYNVIYKAYNNEKTVFSGGKEITGWSLYDSEKNIYRAPSQDIRTRQLYVNGVRAVRARSEKGLTNAVITETGITSGDVFLLDYKRISDLELVFQEKWTQPRIGIESMERTEDGISLRMKQPGWNAATSKGSTSVSKGPVYYENAYELLDREGEWYLDTTDKYFYYIPRSNENMETVNVVAPTLEELIIIEGSSLDNPVHNLSFEGITFSYNTWMWPSSNNGLADVQNNHLRYPGKDDELIPAAVTVKRAYEINFEGCVFSKLGSTGLKLINGVQDSLIQGNRFFDISGSAVNVGEPTVNNVNIYNPRDLRLLMLNIKVKNNYIHDIGVEYLSAAAISAGFPVDSEFSHNHIFQIPYSAIHIGYGWHYFDTTVMKNVKVENNYIHDLLGMGLYDGGAIYAMGRSSAGMEDPNLVSGNFIQNQMNKTAVLYADDGCNYWEFSSNVIDQTETPEWPGGGEDRTKAVWAMGKTKDLIFDGNYTTTDKYMNSSAEPFIITDTYVYPDADWPLEALNIIENAGLEPGYSELASGSLERAYLPETLDLDKGEFYKLNVIATKNKGEPADISSAVLYYYSDDENVAKVSNEGVIEAVGAGRTVIRTELVMGEVVRRFNTVVYVNDRLESIKFRNLTGNERKIIKGDTLDLGIYGVTTLGNEVNFDYVSYVSSNPGIVSVDSKGRITGINEGKAEIYVTASYRGVTLNRVITLGVITYSSEEGLAYEAYSLNEAFKDSANWRAYPTGTSLQFNNGEVRIQSNNMATYEGEKFGNQLLTFHMNIRSDAGWEVIQFRNQAKDKTLDTTYAVVIKPDVIELQRFNNGQRTVIFGTVSGFSSIGGDGYSNDIMPFNEQRLVQVGAVNEEEGVRLILNIDGRNIFYYLDDDENRILEPGYFSIFARYGSVVLSQTPGASLTGPDEVESRKLFSVTGSVSVQRSMEVKQATLIYDSNLLEYNGVESLLDNSVSIDEDLSGPGTLKLNFSGATLENEGIYEIFTVTFKAKQTTGISDICLDSICFTGEGGISFRTVPVKRAINIAAGEETALYSAVITAGNGGRIVSATSGSYAPGAVITLEASAYDGYLFDKWTSTGGGTFSNQYAATTTFTMPAANATITAHFIRMRDVSESETETGYHPAPEETPADTRPVAEPPIIAEENGAITTISAYVTADADEEKGMAKARTDEVTISKIISLAKEAEASGHEVMISFNMEAAEVVNRFELEIPRETFRHIAEVANAGIRVNIGMAAIILDSVLADVLNSGSSTGDIRISISKVDRSLLPEEIQEKTGDRPVFEFTIMAGDARISDFGGGKAKVSIFYVPEPDENENFIVVPYLATAKRLGLVTGTGNNRYEPEETIHRQDMIVILYRILEKLNELPAGVSNKNPESFADADSVADYAKEAMKLFVETGIIEGNGVQLAPRATATRAEAAQILYNLLSR